MLPILTASTYKSSACFLFCRQFALNYLNEIAPPQWKHKGFVKIAIHVRRGDFLNAPQIAFGHTVADQAYFLKAMDYFVKRCMRVQFVVISLNQDWARTNIVFNDSVLTTVNATWSPDMVNVTYAARHTAGQDMAVMAASDHSIISVGSYGWWGGWLGRGTTVYYKGYPKVPSAMGNGYQYEDYVPPGWIGM